MRLSLVVQRADRFDHERTWGAIGTVAILGALLLPVERMGLRCSLRALTGIPCPTCGAMRSIIELRALNLAGAVGMNPLFAAFVLFGVLYCAYAWVVVLFRMKRLRIVATRAWEPMAARLLAATLFLANWAYLVWVGR